MYLLFFSDLAFKTGEKTAPNCFPGAENTSKKVTKHFEGMDFGMELHLKPTGSMYGIFAYIQHKNQPNVGKYTIPMDGMGNDASPFSHS